MTEKLVRDLIPYVILRDTGSMPKMRLAVDKREKLEFLLHKLDEEVAEFKEAMRADALLDYSDYRYNSAVEEAAKEGADVVAVLSALISFRHIMAESVKKDRDRGGFSQAIIIDFA